MHRASLLFLCCLMGCAQRSEVRFEPYTDYDEHLLREDSVLTSSWSADYSRLNLCVTHLCIQPTTYGSIGGNINFPKKKDPEVIQNALTCEPCRSMGETEITLKWMLGEKVLKEKDVQTDLYGDVKIDRIGIIALYESRKAAASDAIAKLCIDDGDKTRLEIEIPPAFFDRSFQPKLHSDTANISSDAASQPQAASK